MGDALTVHVLKLISLFSIINVEFLSVIDMQSCLLQQLCYAGRADGSRSSRTAGSFITSDTAFSDRL